MSNKKSEIRIGEFREEPVFIQHTVTLLAATEEEERRKSVTLESSSL
jgi:hypothetical protein